MANGAVDDRYASAGCGRGMASPLLCEINVGSAVGARPCLARRRVIAGMRAPRPKGEGQDGSAVSKIRASSLSDIGTFDLHYWDDSSGYQVFSENTPHN